MSPNQYCPSLSHYERLKSLEVKVGSVSLGNGLPIRIQSMTTTSSMDTNATVQQSIRLIESGCDYVRITAPSIKDAENLAPIKKAIRIAGYQTPLIADIHFTPKAALIAARIVEKIRVNPGNFIDKKRFEHINYTDSAYTEELDKLRKNFIPLIRICKEYGTAIRIGTNHGSLSDRIMSRYGDTPIGMVESAMEFLAICEDENFEQIVLSMKSSNTQVMVQAYRLLVHRMMQQGKIYPLHLGVTEAGDGADGRIKSSLGIGTLMEDGLGDTIRVSLTEEPEMEVPVAKKLVMRYQQRSNREIDGIMPAININPFSYKRRKTREVLNIGGSQVPVVVADFSMKNEIKYNDLESLGYYFDQEHSKWNITDAAADYVFSEDQMLDFELAPGLGVICAARVWQKNTQVPNHFPFFNFYQFLSAEELHPHMNVVYATLPDLNEELIKKLTAEPTAVLLIDTYHEHGMAEQRAIFYQLEAAGCDVPVIIGRAFGNLSEEQLHVDSAVDIGSLFIDGFGDGIFIAAENCGADSLLNQTAFGILQASRCRISKTEFISCPSCGRTLFDLQQTTAAIRSRTHHLKGVKIGIMGCIVNGPGEMADADFGYVGSGPGKVTLYKGKEVVERNINSTLALDRLIQLIKESGRWIDANSNAPKST